MDGDRVARFDIAAGQHNAHDPGLADQTAVRVPLERRGHQALLKTVQLDARIAQSRHLDHRTVAEPKLRPRRQAEQIDP